MRILIFAAGGDIGGGKTHIINLAEKLSKKNDLRLVCFRVGEMSNEAKERGIDTVAVDVRKGFSAAKALAFSQAKEFKPDVINCHGAKANLLGIMVKNALGCTVMTTVHSDPDIDYLGSPLRNISFGNANRWALRRMDYYVTVSDYLSDLLISKGFDPYKISTVFNALDYSNAEDSFSSGAETITVGIAARLTAVKDFPTLIKAFAIAYEKDKRLRLSIAGIGEEENNIRTLVDSFHLNDVTRFEGWISDMPGYFKNIDINVLSSVSEGLPYSLLEGAMKMVPVIASNVGGIPYLVKHEDTGLLFEPGDAEKFAEEILLLASDDELRHSYGRKLYEKADADFSLEKMCSNMQAVYEKLVKRKASQIQSQRRGVVLCGAYGKGNAGDDAILRAIIGSMRNIDDDIPVCVMSRKPKETRLENRVNSIFTFNIFALRKELSKAKLFISGGGTLIQDVTSTRSILFYLYSLRLAKRMGCRVEMYGCGIGPVNKQKNRIKTTKVLNSCVDVITLRDSISLDLLKEINVTKPEIVLAADPTVNLPEADKMLTEKAFKSFGTDIDTPKIIFCLRPWPNFNDYSSIIKAAEYVYEKYGYVSVFFPMEYPRDVAIGKEIGARIKTPCFVSEMHYSVEELRGMLASAKLVVGMRLHSLVFAASGGAPVVGISYDVKVDSFIKDSGSKRLISLDMLDADSLIQNIDLALTDGRSMGEETKRKLQALEKHNSDYAAKLLEVV